MPTTNGLITGGEVLIEVKEQEQPRPQPLPRLGLENRNIPRLTTTPPPPPQQQHPGVGPPEPLDQQQQLGGTGVGGCCGPNGSREATGHQQQQPGRVPPEPQHQQPVGTGTGDGGGATTINYNYNYHYYYDCKGEIIGSEEGFVGRQGSVGRVGRRCGCG